MTNERVNKDVMGAFIKYPKDLKDKFLGHDIHTVLRQLSEHGDISDINYVRESVGNVLAASDIISYLHHNFVDVANSDEELDEAIAKVKALPGNIDIFSNPDFQEEVKKCFISSLSPLGETKNNFKIARKIQKELGKGVDFTESIKRAITNAVKYRFIGYSGKIKSEFKEARLDLKGNNELKEMLLSYFKDGYLSLVKEFERELDVHFDYSGMEGYEDVLKKAFIDSLGDGRTYDAYAYIKLLGKDTGPSHPVAFLKLNESGAPDIGVQGGHFDYDYLSIDGFEDALDKGLASILTRRYATGIKEDVNELLEKFGKNTALATEEGLMKVVERVYLNANFDDIRGQIREAYSDKIDFDKLDTQKRKAA